jgi:hypothetical protein
LTSHDAGCRSPCPAGSHDASASAKGDRLAELTAVDAELARADKAIDRNNSAYENGTLDEETLAERLPALRATTKQLEGVGLENAVTVPTSGLVRVRAG